MSKQNIKDRVSTMKRIRELDAEIERLRDKLAVSESERDKWKRCYVETADAYIELLKEK